MGPAKDKHGVRESFAKVKFLFAKNGRSGIKEFWSTTLRHFEQFWAVLSNFEQLWAILSNFFGPAWVKQFWAFLSGNAEQFCTAFGNTIWHCRPWTVFKMSQLRLLWDILLWLKKVTDVNPTDPYPKTRSVNIYIYIHFFNIVYLCDIHTNAHTTLNKYLYNIT